MITMRILVLESEYNFTRICGKQIHNEISFHFLNDFLPDRTRLSKLSKILERYDGVVSIHYDDPYINYLIYEANRIGLFTGLIIDGPLEFMNLYANPAMLDKPCFRPIIHKYCFAISPQQVKYLSYGNTKVHFSEYKNYRAKGQIKKIGAVYDINNAC